MSAAAVAGWAIEALIASTLLMVAVLLLRAPVRRAFGAQVAYALWALPLLRLLLPPLPAAWREAAATPIARASETITILVIDPGAHSAAAPVADHPQYGLLIALLWAVGAAVFLVWHFARHTFFCRRMLRSSHTLDERAGIRVIASAAAPGPLAFGVVRRYVAFPQDFADRYDEEERALALAHEIGHHERGDLIANWAALAVLAVHWFNPLAWHAFRAFRADQELANDARVLAGRSPLERHAYACAIIKAAHGGAVSAACHLHTISDLKGRLRMLKTIRASRSRLATGGALVSVLVCTGLVLTASGTSAASALSDRVETAVGVDLQAMTPPPAPPAPPVAPDAMPSPPTPSTPPTPATPPTPPKPRSTVTTTVTDDGKVIRKRVIHIRDGKTIEDSIDLSDVPEISDRTCRDGKDGGPRELVLNKRDGKKRVMIICTNRIEAVAAEGAATAANSADIERHALESALAGLRSARAGIAGNPALTGDQRVAALKGIEEGLAEIERDLASVR